MLEDGLNDIVSVLVEHQILEHLGIPQQVLKEELLRSGGIRAADHAFDHVRADLLRAVVLQILTDEGCNLDVDIFVVVLKYLLHDVVAELVVDELVELCDAHVHQRLLYP